MPMSSGRMTASRSPRIAATRHPKLRPRPTESCWTDLGLGPRRSGASKRLWRRPFPALRCAGLASEPPRRDRRADSERRSLSGDCASEASAQRASAIEVAPAATSLEALPSTICWRLAADLADAGLHAELWTDCKVLPDIAARLRTLPIEVVIDHMGGFDVSAGIDEPGFRCLLVPGRKRPRLGQAVRLSQPACANPTSSAASHFTKHC